MTQVVSFPVTNQAAKRFESPRYIGLAESNKLLRKALKALFPGVKFSVVGDSYSGGSSTRIKWTDGPSTEQVDAIARGFSNKGFDGMIDMSFGYDQWLLPSGLIIRAGTSGTAGSMGTVEGFTTEKPEGAELVSSGIGYVFTSRDVTPEFVASVKVAYENMSGQTRCDLLNKITGRYGMPEDLNDTAAVAKVLARTIAAPPAK